MDTKKLLAELLGTFTFFLIGFMAILSPNVYPGGRPTSSSSPSGSGSGCSSAIQIFGGRSPAATTTRR